MQDVRRIEDSTDSEKARRGVEDGKRMVKKASKGEVRVRIGEKKRT